MTSWPSSRYLIAGWLAVGCIAFGQQPTGSTPKQKPGVPGVQAPMSFLIPDAQYKIEANGINVITDAERKGSPRSLFWPWFAANVSVLGLSYGSFELGFGISFWPASA